MDAFSSSAELAAGEVLDARCWRCEARPPATDVGLCGACHAQMVDEEYVRAVAPTDPTLAVLEAVTAAAGVMAQGIRAIVSAYAGLAPAVAAAAAALAPLLRSLSSCPSCRGPLPKRGACRRCVARP